MSETAPSDPRPSVGRRLAGLAAGIAALLVLGYPIVVTALLANFSFTGCFLECSEPRPGQGIAWSIVTALLLAAPVFLGLAVARVRSRAARVSAGAAVLVVVTAWAVLSLTT
jgi:hypothetical protein